MNTTPLVFEEDGRLGDKPRIPLADLEALFGPGVKPALETLGREMQKRREAQPSELTELLIGYTNKDRYPRSTSRGGCHTRHRSRRGSGPAL